MRANVTKKKYNLRCKHGVVYTLFYGRIRIPRNLGNIDAWADSVYQALFSPPTRESLGTRLVMTEIKQNSWSVKGRQLSISRRDSWWYFSEEEGSLSAPTTSLRVLTAILVRRGNIGRTQRQKDKTLKFMINAPRTCTQKISALWLEMKRNCAGALCKISIPWR